MSGRGRPKRNAKRPARLTGPDRESAPPKRSKGSTAQASDQEQSREDEFWWDPQSTEQAPQTPAAGTSFNHEQSTGDQTAILERLNMLESALALQKAASKGQELDELSITVPSDLWVKILGGGKFVDFTQLMAKSFLERQDS